MMACTKAMFFQFSTFAGLPALPFGRAVFRWRRKSSILPSAFLVPEIRIYYDSEQGQREFAE